MTLPLVTILLGECIGTIGSFITSPFTAWFPIVVAATLMILMLLGLIYMLSPLVGRNDIRNWVRVKIYDELFSIVLIFVFLAFATLLCTVNPTGPLNAVGLLPTECNPANTTATPSTAGIGTIYGIATCDIYQFNQDFGAFSNWAYGAVVLFGAAPQIGFAPGVSPLGGPPGSTTFQGVGLRITIELLPFQLAYHYLVPLMGLFFALALVSQMQVLLVSSALLIFSTLMVIGLIARSFGVTRTFGGAMMALALGIGFVYPVLTAISYGFLDYTIDNWPNLIGGAGSAFVHLGQLGAVYTFGAALAFLVALLTGGPINGCSNPNPVLAVACFINPALMYASIVMLGITFIPMLNFVIVDAFIIDFSKAVGERMDFLSLLTRII